MFLSILLLLSAVSLSVTAAYFSIVGLAAIFAAVYIPVVIMGSVLEFAKVLTATWLHVNWKNPLVSTFMRFYLTLAIIALMLITALGIYGFLAKGHIEQEIPLQQQAQTLKSIEQNIERQKYIIEQSKEYIDDLEKQIEDINQNIKSIEDRSNTLDERAQSLSQRSSQVSNQIANLNPSIFNSKKEERAALENQLNLLSKQINDLNAEKDKLNQEKQQLIDQRTSIHGAITKEKESIENKLESMDSKHEQISTIESDRIDAEVKLGPIKYVAELLGLDDPNAAIKIVILVIMFAFDPLAIMMVICAYVGIRDHRKKDPLLKKYTIKEETKTLHEQESELVLEEELKRPSKKDKKSNQQDWRRS